LKNTNAVSSTTGKARTANTPTVARCDSITRTAHPTTEPAPQPVRISTTATTMASCASWETPDTVAATHATTTTAIVETPARVWPLGNRDTSQPTIAISGSVSPTMTSTINSEVVGFPVISTSWPPVIK
jgi:hypothetical protein